MHLHRPIVFLNFVIPLLLVACSGDEQAAPQAGDPVLVYASHNAAEVATVLDSYRSETGNRFRILTDDMAENATRLGNPQLMPQADVFIGASLAELWAVAEADALRPHFSEALTGNVPAQLRDEESRWFALSMRARVIVYNTDRISAEQLESVEGYAALRSEAFSGQLCIASSAVPGNRSLVAFLIKQHGVREAELVVREWRANLGMTVFTNDGTLLNAIADGRCGIGFIDSNILASFVATNSEVPIAPHWFADSANTLIDVSAAGVTRHAKNPEAAVAFLTWLVSESPNALFARLKFDFPVNSASPVGDEVAVWSEHLPQVESLTALGFLLEEADRLIERAGYP